MKGERIRKREREKEGKSENKGKKNKNDSLIYRRKQKYSKIEFCTITSVFMRANNNNNNNNNNINNNNNTVRYRMSTNLPSISHK